MTVGNYRTNDLFLHIRADAACSSKGHRGGAHRGEVDEPSKQSSNEAYRTLDKFAAAATGKRCGSSTAPTRIRILPGEY
jgi:hypothetical protein